MTPVKQQNMGTVIFSRLTSPMSRFLTHSIWRDISPVMVNETRRPDPAMLGQTRYPRTPLDHYPTQPPSIKALMSVPYVAERIAGSVVWEPCCGDGAITQQIAPHVAATISTDIAAYEGFDPDALIDLLSLNRLSDLSDVHGVNLVPTGIITNPPYGDLAQPIIEKSIELMREVDGFVMMMVRHEWDCADSRTPLFADHPAFAAKITLTFRPHWVVPKPGEKQGSPRFSYAWLVWDWQKPAAAAPLQLYARRPR